ncbi:hypothetical protein HRbin12_01586 [bacterium HR12]|nr:hypothetical protein HRbin12_01586 [bacterium HR12]
MADADVRETSEQGAEARPIAHDDIMRRLLEYQRQLREGVPPSEAAKAVAESDPSALRAEPASVTITATEAVVDLTRAEAELEAEAGTTEQEASEAAAGVEAEAGSGGEAEVASAAEPSAEPPRAASPAAEQVPSTEALAGPVEARPDADPALSARLERLERTLGQVAAQVSHLRQRFQDLAIAADERLAELERTLARAREP